MTAETDFEKMSDYEVPDSANVPAIIEKIVRKLQKHRHIILYGPPGTGKTRILSSVSNRTDLSIGHTEFVQFHQQYSYQDFIEGFTVRNGQFDYKAGVFLDFVDQINTQENDLHHILFVDEINRADISSVFGELLTLLDDPIGKTIRLPASDRQLQIRHRFSIVGTMNSADKNIAIMDFALRRRFDFIFVPPDYDGMTEWLNESGFEFDEFSIDQYVCFAAKINRRIASHPILGKNMTLGQALFVPPNADSQPLQLIDVCEMVSDKVIPQIEAYVGIGNYSDLAMLLSPDIRRKAKKGEVVVADDVVNLIRSIAPQEER